MNAKATNRKHALARMLLPGLAASLSLAAQAGEAKDPNDPNDPVNRSFANLVAATEGPILGVCEQWDGHFCANGNLPRFDPRAIPNLMRQKEADMAAFENSLSQFAGWYTQRPLGARKEPGGTGGQEDFGATKGTYATVFGDPRHIRGMQYSVYADFFRALCHYESNGQILRAGNHPQWVTWSGITHFNNGVSPDRLGKPGPQFSGTGWLGYDDEHHSRNNLAAYAMLSDDPLVDLLCQHELETMRASYRSRYPQFGEGATRAQGRLAGAMAQFASIDVFGFPGEFGETVSGGFERAFVNLADLTDRTAQIVNQAPGGILPGFKGSGLRLAQRTADRRPLIPNGIEARSQRNEAFRFALIKQCPRFGQFGREGIGAGANAGQGSHFVGIQLAPESFATFRQFGKAGAGDDI